MKLAQCILAFEKGISTSTRPEDRTLASTYLSALALLLAKAIEQQPLSAEIENLERLFGQTWIVDVDPFRDAFDLWEEAKTELING